ncbi:SH3 domain-containing protein [Aliikangiella sp. G2MR2-5]|uniref:SH3 domain-containing protein n=1 Tax=Aliikangiella sp. G2MR2-5 TaxID=2788943 RepID=UPI0018AB252F|nr:SH3 domain-containing protein [Aliikangiella sp. G2MR2-5]
MQRIDNPDFKLKSPNKFKRAAFYGVLLFSTSVFKVPFAVAESQNDSNSSVELEVIDPYLEVHTGPGQGYPVIYTVEQGEKIFISTRRPDWYEISTEDGHSGWVKASQIARTLLPTGEPVDLPSVSYGDYLERSLYVGLNVGQFSSGELESSDTFSFLAGFRAFSWGAVEIEQSQFYNADYRGQYFGINFKLEPFSDWVVSPVLTLGGGEMEVTVQPKQLLSIEQDDYFHYGIGASYYLGRNFVMNINFDKYDISTEQSDKSANRWNLGFNAFF